MATAVLTPPKTTRFHDPYEPVPDLGDAIPEGFEFIDGQLVEQKMSHLSSFMAGECYFHLSSHVEPRNLGWLFPAGNSYKCFDHDKDLIRRPDTAFHHLHRLTAEQVMTEGHSSVVPDLVVEVISPNDLADDVNRKSQDWLKAGVQLLWVLHPLDRTIHAYHSNGSVQLFRETDVLTAEPVLPDFRVSMKELFRMPGAVEAG